MRIRSFWAKGYRSLKDVRLDDLGDFNIFYGKNGTGKSNVLSALRAFFGLLAGQVGTIPYDEPLSMQTSPYLALEDLCRQDPSGRVTLGASLLGSEESSLSIGGASLAEVTVEITVDCLITGEPLITLSKLQLRQHQDSPLRLSNNLTEGPFPRALRAFLVERLGRGKGAFALVGGASPWVDSTGATGSRGTRTAESSHLATVCELLDRGAIAQALAEAQQSPEASLRSGFETLRQILQEEPLCRPPFDSIRDPVSNRFELRERSSRGHDILMDLKGQGLVRIYTILSHILLRGADLVGIEEPEAHLHAPSTGRELRTLLQRVVQRGYIRQLFIVTHSNLFDLDPSRYYDVRLDDEGCTQVERVDDMSRLDRDHLYEPGPAKHVLLRMLAYQSGETYQPGGIVFRRPDGSPITVQEMAEMLQSNDPLAVEFLRDMHGAAVRMVSHDAESVNKGIK